MFIAHIHSSTLCLFNSCTGGTDIQNYDIIDLISYIIKCLRTEGDHVLKASFSNVSEIWTTCSCRYPTGVHYITVFHSFQQFQSTVPVSIRVEILHNTFIATLQAISKDNMCSIVCSTHLVSY